VAAALSASISFPAPFVFAQSAERTGEVGIKKRDLGVCNALRRQANYRVGHVLLLVQDELGGKDFDCLQALALQYVTPHAA